ncbi:MAG: hypothetical protein AB1742_10405 [bacterium]
MKQIAIKYSGGTDSTATAALMAEKFDRIHLVTCSHSGLKNVGNSARNIEKLMEIYGNDRFVHVILDVDRLYKMVTYADYLKNVRKHGFFVLTSCGMCHLSMHIRTLVYCMDNGIAEVADGSNKNSSLFPTQMETVIDEIRKMYARFGMNFTNPVYDYEFPTDIDWKHKFGLVRGAPEPPPGTTTGQVLFNRGILDRENVKGTATDRGMQPRCFQLTLLNLFALKYYIPRHGMDEYRKGTTRFYSDKVDLFTRRLEQFFENRRGSILSRVIGPESKKNHDET